MLIGESFGDPPPPRPPSQLAFVGLILIFWNTSNNMPKPYSVRLCLKQRFRYLSHIGGFYQDWVLVPFMTSALQLPTAVITIYIYLC